MTIVFSPDQLILPGAIGLVLLIFSILFIVRTWTQKGWILELLAGIVSTGVGCYLGMGAQILYTSGGEIPLFGNGYENPMWVGGVIGGVFGFLAGVWFIQYLRARLNNGQTGGQVIGKGALIGVVLGMICSTVVHVLLMMAYRNMHFGPLLIGLCFGVGVGIQTGLVVSVVFILAKKMGLIKIKEQL